MAFASSAYGLEPKDIFGKWQGGPMRVEIAADYIVIGFGPPTYDQDVERTAIKFQDYEGGLLLKAPDGSGFLAVLKADGSLGWTFPGVGAATLQRVTTDR